MTIITTQLPFKGVMTSNIGGRKENQDTCGYSETSRGLLLVVCDGMGGGPGGKTASSIAATTLIGYVQQHGDQTDENGDLISTEKLLHDAIAAANTALRDKIIEVPDLNGMGTTVTAVLLTPDSATVAHVGDSRIYQLRKRSMVFRTADHSRVGEMVRAGALTEEQARLSAISNLITRALGIGDEVQIDVETVPYEKGDRFVLCTDGIWGSMPQEELIKFFTEKKPLENIAQTLNISVENIGREKGGGHDNYTIIMAEVLGSSTDAMLKADDETDPKMASKMPFNGLKSVSPAMIAVVATAILVFIIFLCFSKCSGTPVTPGEKDSDTVKVAANDTVLKSDSIVEDVKGVAKTENGKAVKDATVSANDKKGDTPEEKKDDTKNEDITQDVKAEGEKTTETNIAQVDAPAASDPELAGLTLEQLNARREALKKIISDVNQIKVLLGKIQNNTNTATEAIKTKERIRKDILDIIDQLEEIKGYTYSDSELERLFYVSKDNKKFSGLRGGCNKTPLTEGDFTVMYKTIGNLLSTLQPRLTSTEKRIEELQNQQ